MVAARLVEACHQMIAAGTGGAGANRELSCQLGLAGGGECGAFFMTDADPLDLASPDRIGQRIRESPINPKTCLTPTCSSALTNWPATVCDMIPLLMMPVVTPSQRLFDNISGSDTGGADPVCNAL